MRAKRNLLMVGAFFVLAIMLVSSASAFADIDRVEVRTIESGQHAVFAGETIPVRVVFTADETADDVRIRAWISGESAFTASTERFDIVKGSTYSRLLSVNVPFDLDEELNEELTLFVTVENRADEVREEVNLEVQRESYLIEILSSEMPTKVSAGSALSTDVVLKNRGRQEAEDTFVRVSIPALGISTKVFYGDLSSVDQDDPDKQDSEQRRVFLNIPSNAPAGVYVVEVEAFNSDSTTTSTNKVAIVGASADSSVFAPVTGRSFAIGEEKAYSLTLVNSGSNVVVYQIIPEVASGLSINAEEPIVAVPAGSSKTVQLNARASEEGNYNFAVNVHSDGNLVKKVDLTANVEGSKAYSGNSAVLLTVILVIIFVVLLVVLIVLLTRKPARNDELGESYY